MQVDELPEIPEQRVRDWLYYEKKKAPDDRPRIKSIAVKQPLLNEDERSGLVEIKNLTKPEVEAMRSMLAGHAYVTCFEGRLHSFDVLEKLPDPVVDTELSEHWQSKGSVAIIGGRPSRDGWHCPSIFLHGAGAGCRDEAQRVINRQRISECGFQCYRSQRQPTGEFFEVWFVHTWSAQGPLKRFLESESIKNLDWHQKAEAACNWLATDHAIRFGSLDIVIQRWCLSSGD